MEQMRELFHKASEADRPVFISAVNWAEVLYKMERKHGKAGYDTARQFEHTTPLEAVPVDRELAEIAALLKNEHGLGLADAFAAALATAPDERAKQDLIDGNVVNSNPLTYRDVAVGEYGNQPAVDRFTANVRYFQGQPFQGQPPQGTQDGGTDSGTGTAAAGLALVARFSCNPAPRSACKAAAWPVAM